MIDASVVSKRHLHEIMQRNGWYVPSAKSSFVTVDYLHKVRTGQVYCPKFEEVRLRPCPVRPDKELVVTEVLRVCTEHGKNLGDCSRQRPNKGWLLKVLSTLKPEHYFFAKAYMPAPRPRKREVKKLDFEGHFFADQPARHRYTKVSRRTVNMLLSKQEDLPVPPQVGPVSYTHLTLPTKRIV